MNENSKINLCLLTAQPRRSIRLAPGFMLGALLLILSIAFTTFPGTTEAAAAADTDRGKQLFEKRCTGCHSLDQDKEGPRLRGVYGRKAGAVAGFPYSDGVKASHIVWDNASLDKWLANPDALIADNDMAFHVADAGERAEIIRFLQASSGK